MCVHKLKIPNLAFYEHDILSSPYVEVNCGHCWQCKLERSNGFTFRVLQEVLKPNCIPFFVTLTYNNDYLPYLEFIYTDDSNNDHFAKVSCWNRTHVQRFHKRIRRKLQYYYGLDTDSFKFLCSCERGSDKEYISDSGRKRIATKRPHYHLLYMLFVPDCVLPCRTLPSSYYAYLKQHELSDNFSSFFQYLLSDNWYYGFVDDVAFCRDVVAASTYVTKYLTKDVSEGLFNIPIYRFSRLLDKDYDDKYALWYERNKLKLVYDHSLDALLGDKPYTPHSSFPRPVKHTSLFPRAFCSINLGLSWLYDKTLSELRDYFVGKRKVTLPFTKSSSLVNLPYYYFRRCCKEIKRLHDNRYYLVNRLVGGVLKTHKLFTLPRKSSQIYWDNVHGLSVVTRPSYYTVLQTSDFGKSCIRLRKFANFKRLCLQYSHFCFQPFYFRNLLNRFNSLPLVFQSFTPGVSDDVFSNLVAASFDCFFKSLIKFKHSKFILSSSDDLLSNLLNLFALCQFTKSHLNHVAFELNYFRRIGKSAFDNPDLFLNHYI